LALTHAPRGANRHRRRRLRAGGRRNTGKQRLASTRTQGSTRKTEAWTQEGANTHVPPALESEGVFADVAAQLGLHKHVLVHLQQTGWMHVRVRRRCNVACERTQQKQDCYAPATPPRARRRGRLWAPRAVVCVSRRTQRWQGHAKRHVCTHRVVLDVPPAAAAARSRARGAARRSPTSM
jgi:hypothetical protein